MKWKRKKEKTFLFIYSSVDHWLSQNTKKEKERFPHAHFSTWCSICDRSTNKFRDENAMQSLHYNNGSIKLTRERSTMVARWESEEVARWISGKTLSSLFFLSNFVFFRSRRNSTGNRRNFSSKSNQRIGSQFFITWRFYSNGNFQNRSTVDSSTIDRSSFNISRSFKQWNFSFAHYANSFSSDELFKFVKRNRWKRSTKREQHRSKITEFLRID